MARTGLALSLLAGSTSSSQDGWCPSGWNAASLAERLEGKGKGRPSNALAPEQAMALLSAAKGTRLEAYIVLSLTTGIRTEEARALCWDHVDLEAGTVAVWHSVRHGGDTKTVKSRRGL